MYWLQLSARDDGVSGAHSAAELAVLQPGGRIAQLVLRAAAPWSPHNHALFPRAARCRAVALLRIGFALEFQKNLGGIGALWVALVMPRLVLRPRRFGREVNF